MVWNGGAVGHEGQCGADIGWLETLLFGQSTIYYMSPNNKSWFWTGQRDIRHMTRLTFQQRWY